MPINRVQFQPGLSPATFFGSYGITGADVRDAFEAALAASTNLGLSDQKTVAEVRAMLPGRGRGSRVWRGYWSGSWRAEFVIDAEN